MMRIPRDYNKDNSTGQDEQARRSARTAVSGFVLSPENRRRLAQQLRKRSRKATIVEALVGSGIDASTINDIKNMTTFLVSSLDEAVRERKATTPALQALQRCESLFERAVFRSSEQFEEDLLVSIRNFLMEAQSVLSVLKPYAGTSVAFTPQDNDTLQAKLFVLNYLASSIDSHFSTHS